MCFHTFLIHNMSDLAVLVLYCRKDIHSNLWKVLSCSVNPANEPLGIYIMFCLIWNRLLQHFKLAPGRGSFIYLPIIWWLCKGDKCGGDFKSLFKRMGLTVKLHIRVDTVFANGLNENVFIFSLRWKEWVGKWVDKWSYKEAIRSSLEASTHCDPQQICIEL